MAEQAAKKRTGRPKTRFTEKSIATGILTWLNKQPDCIAEKVQGTHFQAGRADINASICGLCVKIEVKTPTGKATPLQLAYLEKWQGKGAIGVIARGKPEVMQLVENIREFTRKDVDGE